MYVYIMSEPGLLTVGFYDPNGKWHPDSDFNNRDEAAERVHYLNGGINRNEIAKMIHNKLTPKTKDV